MCSLIATKHIHISSQFAILTLYSIFGWYMLTKRATISFLCYILMVITVLVLQMQSGTAFSPSRESSMLSQRHKRHDELPGTWYKQYAEKFRTLHGKFRPDDKEMPKRTPEGMSDYLKVCSVHKRKRTVFMDKQGPNIMLENGEFSNLTDDPFIPEIQFPADCVPESAIPRESGISISNKIEVHGVLDNLPAPVSRNTAMLERFGMMPEYYKTGNKYRGKDVSKVEGKSLSQEQALLITRKLVARYLAVAGFESGTAGSVDDFSDIIVKHISKLGRNLKLITDSYRKQFSSIELLKMFLQTVGYRYAEPFFVYMFLSCSVCIPVALFVYIFFLFLFVFLAFLSVFCR